jgi:GNAT superfamily N-acetyltransferase
MSGKSNSSPAEFRVRRCEDPVDADEIHRLVYELALYEKQPRSMTSTVDDFRRDGFETSPPLFYADLAECSVDGGRAWRAVGVSLYYTTYSSWRGRTMYLEDIFVEPAWRGRGLGLTLMKHAARAANSLQCSRLQWIVLDWNKRSIEFYKSCGAHEQSEWKLMRFERDGLERFASGESR